MHRTASSDLSELLLTLYSVGAAQPPWPEFLEELARRTDADGAALLTHDLRSGKTMGIWIGYELSEADRFTSYYSAINPWMPKESAALAVGGTVTSSDAVMPLSQLRKTEFYTDWGKRNEVVHSVIANLGMESGFLRYFGLNRGESRGPLSDEALQLLALLTPHLQNAVRLEGLLAVAEDLRQALDSLRLPVVLVDREARAIEMSRAAERLVRRRDGFLRLDARRQIELRGRPSPALATDLARLEARTPFRFLRVVGPGGQDQVVLLAKAAFAYQQAPERYLVVLLEESAPPGNGLQEAARLYRLTPAETRLVETLVANGALDLTIEQLGVTRNTARTQLASIFAKTGTSRQGQVIRIFSLLGRVTHLGDDEVSGER